MMLLQGTRFGRRIHWTKRNITYILLRTDKFGGQLGEFGLAGLRLD
jgi:hypothetical protein